MIFPGEAEPSIGRHLLAGGEAVVYSCRSPDKATLNEDAAAVIPLGGASGVLVVADGMGGAPAGREAAQRVVNHVVDALREPVSDAERLRTKILDGIERANEAVRELGMGAGATLVVAEICEGIVRPYHAGDAAVMLVGQRGKLKCLTVPHSPVGFAVAAGFLDEDEAIHHEQRHLITNLVGAGDMRIEVGPPVRMAPRDRLLLASDGLFDNLSVAEIVERVRKGPLKKVREALSRDALRRMTGQVPDLPSKPDDLTFVVFRLRPPSEDDQTRTPAIPP